MISAHTRSFQKDVDASDRLEILLPEIFRRTIPGYRGHKKGTKQDDKAGIDWFVLRPWPMPALRVEIKTRAEDPLKAFKNENLLLEIYDNGKPGWANDPVKQTDYILWLFEDTGRYELMPYPLLNAAVVKNLEDWKKQYEVKETTTQGIHEVYTSQVIIVPINIIWRAMYFLCRGNL